jgi:hypothetical protein
MAQARITRGTELSTESLTLKWGTLKGWSFQENSPAHQALIRWNEAGSVSMSAAMQKDNDAQKQAVIDIIDAVDTDKIYLDWDGKYVTKEEAKTYVLDYDKK